MEVCGRDERIRRGESLLGVKNTGRSSWRNNATTTRSGLHRFPHRRDRRAATAGERRTRCGGIVMGHARHTRVAGTSPSGAVFGVGHGCLTNPRVVPAMRPVRLPGCAADDRRLRLAEHRVTAYEGWRRASRRVAPRTAHAIDRGRALRMASDRDKLSHGRRVTRSCSLVRRPTRRSPVMPSVTGRRDGAARFRFLARLPATCESVSRTRTFRADDPEAAADSNRTEKPLQIKLSVPTVPRAHRKYPR